MGCRLQYCAYLHTQTNPNIPVRFRYMAQAAKQICASLCESHFKRNHDISLTPSLSALRDISHNDDYKPF